jgi:UDP-N-acetylglucosamine 1-carboxyvinyltransferase
VIAGLAAEGITQVEGLRHIDRGYEQMELSLAAVGASIQRID